jgi:BirA family biotin operon repressor/biotin-[acetyl-CoA-carboxylase] ligase
MPAEPENFQILDSTNSTNNYAMGLIAEGKAVDGFAVFSNEQTEGKGRRGKAWKSNKGENIILSIIADMQWLSLSRQFELSAAVALGCYGLLNQYSPRKVAIKWPNDLFINDSKAGGVLIENSIKGTLWQWAVIGIGININETDFDELPFKPMSLKLATGNSYNPVELAKQLVNLIFKHIERIKKGEFPVLLEEYNEHLFAKNRLVKLKKGNIVFETTITGVSSSGQLITKDALERQFDFDEIEFKGLV